MQNPPPNLTLSAREPVRRIATLEDLFEHLQWALELEHFTLPPYFCALYSLEPARNPEAVEVVTSVLVEEMLHMTLAANLLNAVGGRPRIDSPEMLSGYPACMPHGDRSFEVPLMRFCPETLAIFLKIEQPALPAAAPQSDHYATIHQFYRAIEDGLRALCAQHGEARIFCGDPPRQVVGTFFGPNRPQLVAIDSLATALAALEQIVEQGEGADPLQVWDGDRDVFHPERQEVAHYYRFKELELGRRFRCGDTPRSGPTGDALAIDWAGVRAMRANPRCADRAPGTPIRAAQEAFNRTYCTLLQLLDQTFDGTPRALRSALGTMVKLKLDAQALMQLPTEDGLETAGPSFEYVAPNERTARRPR